MVFKRNEAGSRRFALGERQWGDSEPHPNRLTKLRKLLSGRVASIGPS